MISEKTWFSFCVRFATLVLIAGSLSSCTTSRAIKTHTCFQKEEAGKLVDTGSVSTESISRCEAKITTAWPLINLFVMPLITTTGPWHDSYEAAQKKYIEYTDGQGHKLAHTELEVKLRMKLGNPMFIASSMQMSAYLDVVFDYIWKQAANEIADRDGSFIACADSNGITRQMFVRPLNPDLVDSQVVITDGWGRTSTHSSYGEYYLQQIVDIFKIRELDVELWARTTDASGKVLNTRKVSSQMRADKNGNITFNNI